MYGSKQNKEANLARLVEQLEARGEMTTGEMAEAINVSRDAIEDYLVSLHDRKVKLCQKGQKISLWQKWFGRK